VRRDKKKARLNRRAFFNTWEENMEEKSTFKKKVDLPKSCLFLRNNVIVFERVSPNRFASFTF